jgi:phosphonoacetate hydrolase
MAAKKKVIVVIFDGLRPDLVSAVETPNLYALAAESTWFREARSVFPSVTRVATTSIATGTIPARHGVVGNLFLFPPVSSTKTFDSRLRRDVLIAEAATNGRFITSDTLAKAGKRLAVVQTGTPGATHFLNPRAAENKHWTFSIHGREATPTPEAIDEAIKQIGPFEPDKGVPRLNDIEYATRLVTEYVLPKLAPEVTIVWYAEPDVAFHYAEIGSATSKRTLTFVDRCFGRLLAWISAQPDSEDYAVIAASDHGHISTTDQINLNGLLTKAGFPTKEGVLDGAMLATTGGNSGEIRILDGDHRTLERVNEWLQAQDFIGMMFSKGRNEIEGHLPGTFAFELAGLAHDRAPDLFFVMRSDEGPDQHGLPGRGLFTDLVPVGGGIHGGLNRYEMNTLLMVRAPGLIPAATITNAHAGIIDIAPTVLDLLGLAIPDSMTGASLLEVPKAAFPEPKTYNARHGRWSQEIEIAGDDARSFIRRGSRLT